MVLCAGLGTRLRPLTDELAKPMVPVGDQPAVAHVVARLRLGGAASRVVINVHHRPSDLDAWAASSDVIVSHERELLGTAGGLSHARDLLGPGDVLVWNGDILSPLDPRDLLAIHATRGGVTLAVRARPAFEGNVGIDNEGRVVRLRTSSVGVETRGGDFLGVHVVGDEIRSRLPDRGCLIRDTYMPCLKRGDSISAYFTPSPFTDIGSVACYLEANAEWLAARSLKSWAHPTATVNAAIDGSVIGAGARVEAPTINSVVWPNTRVGQRLCQGVATPHSRVQVD